MNHIVPLFDPFKFMIKSLNMICLIIGLLSLIGCQAKPNGSDDQGKLLVELVKTSDALYSKYLDGNPDQVKQSLEDLLHNSESAKLAPSGKAEALYQTAAQVFFCKMH